MSHVIFGFNLSFTAHTCKIVCALVNIDGDAAPQVIDMTWLSVTPGLSQQIKRLIRRYTSYRVSIAYTVGPHTSPMTAQLLITGILRGLAVADGIEAVYVRTDATEDVDRLVRPPFLRVLTEPERTAIRTAIQSVRQEVEA